MARTTVKCPACGSQVPWADSSQWRPFCSERCRLLDLGAWFTEDRGIPGEDGEAAIGQSTEPSLPGD